MSYDKYGLTIEVLDITPQMAAEWLKSNTDNFRRLNPARIERYSSDMGRGRWDVNGDTIVFNCNGTLKDGQNRLTGCVKSGKSFRSIVVWGVKEDACSNIDRGQPRRVGQTLRRMGVANYNGVAALATNVVCHDRGLWGRSGWGAGEYTDSDLIEYVRQHEKSLVGSVRIGSHPPRLITGSVLATIAHIGSGRIDDPEDNDTVAWFIDAVRSGSDLSDTDPAFHLRQRFIAELKKTGAKTPKYLERQLATKAWNMTVDGESTGTLRLRFTGPAKNKPIKKIKVAE